MKPHFTVLLLCCILLSTGCINSPSSTNTNDKTTGITADTMILPEDAIAFSFRSGGVYLELTVNDTIKGQFLFDTGSDQLYLDSLFVAQHGFSLDHKSGKEIFGVGEGKQYVPVIRGIRLSLDSLEHEYSNIPVTNIRAIVGNQIDGVFGIELFKPYIVGINFDSSYLKIIYDTANFIAPAIYDSVKLFYLGKSKTVIKCKASLTDGILVSGWTILDLGSGGSLTLTSVIAKEYSLDSAISEKYQVTRKLGGYGGRTSSWYFRADSIMFGNTCLDQPIMNYSVDEKGYLSFWGLLGLLGTKVLERYNIIFDFYNHRFYYTPNETFNTPFKGNMTGFHSKWAQIDSSRLLRVYNVIEGSSADHAGIKTGDLITHLNGIEISKFPSEKREALFLQDSIPNHLQIESNGMIHQVSLIPRKIL